MRQSIRTKLVLYIISVAILVFTPAIGYLGIVNKSDYYNIGKKDIDSEAKKYSIEIEKKIDNYFSTIRTLASVNSTLTEYSNYQKEDLVISNYKKILTRNVNIDGVWDSWEYTRPGVERKAEYKRRMYSAERIGKSIVTSVEIKDLTSGYLEVVNKKYDEAVAEPYLYSFTRREQDKCLVTSLSVKFYNKKVKVGIVGIDIKLSNIQNLLKSINLVDDGLAKVELLSSQANYLSSTDSSLIGSKSEINDSIFTLVKTQGYYSTLAEIDDVEYYKTFSRVKISNTNDFWILSFSVPKSKLEEKSIANLKLTFIIGIIGLILLGIFIIIITIPLTAPILKITKDLKIMAKGELNKVKQNKTDRKDELGDMTRAMNLVGESLKEKTIFAEQIGNGELNSEIHLLSEEDTLGKALVNMRDNLTKAKELETEYKIEEDKRAWANKGYAFFAELLRKNNENLEELSNEIIKNIVKYVDANQGAIYLKDKDDDKFINLISAYAYDRKKFINKKIEIGEGLVGTCFIEAQKIYITDIPDNYINITSGLGDANPTSLILMPLKNEEDVIGVLEMASFKELENFQIEFIEKLANTIAATILTVENNERTKYLLEQTNEQAEEMRSQEEEMRQNFEELIATQEESERKSSEASGLLSALNTANYVIECSKDGVISFVSDSYLKFLEIEASSIIGKKYINILFLKDNMADKFSELWDSVISGNIEKISTLVKVNNSENIMYQTFMPIKNENENVEKVIIISNNLNKFKEL